MFKAFFVRTDDFLVIEENPRVVVRTDMSDIVPRMHGSAFVGYECLQTVFCREPDRPSRA